MPRAPRAVSVPPGLEWWRGEPGGADWLARLPRLVAECAELWSLRLGAAFHDAHISYVAPAELPDGRRAVLKVNFPEPESERVETARWIVSEIEGATEEARAAAAEPARRVHSPCTPSCARTRRSCRDSAPGPASRA